MASWFEARRPYQKLHALWLCWIWRNPILSGCMSSFSSPRLCRTNADGRKIPYILVCFPIPSYVMELSDDVGQLKVTNGGGKSESERCKILNRTLDISVSYLSLLSFSPSQPIHTNFPSLNRPSSSKRIQSWNLWWINIRMRTCWSWVGKEMLLGRLLRGECWAVMCHGRNWLWYQVRIQQSVYDVGCPSLEPYVSTSSCIWHWCMRWTALIHSYSAWPFHTLTSEERASTKVRRCGHADQGHLFTPQYVASRLLPNTYILRPSIPRPAQLVPRYSDNLRRTPVRWGHRCPLRSDQCKQKSRRWRSSWNWSWGTGDWTSVL